MNGMRGLQDISDLGDRQKTADAIDNIARGISKAVRGESSDPYSLSQPIPIQNVVLIGIGGFLAYKFLELIVRGRD